MRYLEEVPVDAVLVDEMWEKVADSGSYYSIGDGMTKNVFRSMLFQSNIVLRGPSVLIRLVDMKECLEAHPIAFGHSFFHHAREALADVMGIRDRFFPEKPICCIIPEGMKGAKRLARVAGMSETGKVTRGLSGVSIPCRVFSWR